MLKYAVSRAEIITLLCGPARAWGAVSDLGLNPCTNRKYPNSPGGVMAEAITSQPQPGNTLCSSD